MDQIIAENHNQGMFYAVRSKPESLLYYPVFKLILQDGWTGMSTDAFKDLILSQIQQIQSKIAEEQGLTGDKGQAKLSERKNPDDQHPTLESDNDLPLASKETIALDSHRPLTYETQHLKATNYNIKTPIMDDFITRDSNHAGQKNCDNKEELTALEAREDRIRTI